MSSPGRGTDILLLSLGHAMFTDEIYSDIADIFRAQSIPIKQAKTVDGALNYLRANKPRALIATDPDWVKKRDVSAALVSYLQNGGRVILGLFFSSLIRMDRFDKLFSETFGLPWKSGDYHRTNFQLNPACALPGDVVKEMLPQPYSMKALHIRDARPHEKIYVPMSGSTVQSMVFAPTPVDQTQAAIVGARIGEGFLAYIGDVNNESASVKIIFELSSVSIGSVPTYPNRRVQVK